MDWKPSAAALATANATDGERLFQRDCATCHDANGQTRHIWRASFKRVPPNLRAGPILDLPLEAPPAQRMDRLAQITKFGIQGTDMPGHEYLPDQQIASIALWLSQNIADPIENK